MSLVVALLLSIGAPATAQTLPVVAPPDTADTGDPPFSPRGAFFRSLILPGWGQSHVGAPGRGAVYFSLAGGSGWMAFVAHRQKADALAQQSWLREIGAIAPTTETDLVAARAQQFEDWMALTVFLFFFAGADAYVSAYLADFDDRIGVTSGSDGSLRLRASMPLRWP